MRFEASEVWTFSDAMMFACSGKQVKRAGWTNWLQSDEHGRLRFRLTPWTEKSVADGYRPTAEDMDAMDWEVR